MSPFLIDYRAITLIMTDLNLEDKQHIPHNQVHFHNAESKFNITNIHVGFKLLRTDIRRAWRYQRVQTTQWTKDKGQRDKQRFTKHTHKTKDRVTRTPLKPGMNWCAPEGWAVSAPLVAPFVLTKPPLLVKWHGHARF